MRTVKAALKLLAFSLWTFSILCLQLIVFLFTTGPIAYVLPHIWERGACYILGIKVRVQGQPHTATQTVYVSNHISYLDILAIGSVLKASFVAKAEVENWPVFGFLSKMQQTAFISRRPTDAGKGKYALSSMLAEGKSLIIFPEGTSSDGQTVLPFKSSLFSVALQDQSARNLVVQPFSIEIVKADGRAPDRQDVRDIYAWHGDMTLAPHLWRFLKTSGVELVLHFHEIKEAASYSCRKDLSRICFEDVKQGVVQPA